MPNVISILSTDSPDHRARLEGKALSLRPRDESKEALDDFQRSVAYVRRHDGTGYSIFFEHRVPGDSDRLVDLVLAELKG